MIKRAAPPLPGGEYCMRVFSHRGMIRMVASLYIINCQKINLRSRHVADFVRPPPTRLITERDRKNPPLEVQVCFLLHTVKVA